MDRRGRELSVDARRRTCQALAAGALLLLAAAPAVAQSKPRPSPPEVTRPARFSIGINGGFQAASNEFEDGFTFTRDQETGTTRTNYPVEGAMTLDAGFGVRLWRGIGAGVALSRLRSEAVATTSSSVPHPLFLQQHREVTGEANGMEREETGVHVQVQYLAPFGRKLQLALMAGPSFVQINQTLVIDVNYTQAYPYDTATFEGVDSRRVTGSATGFNVGADLSWLFTRNVGAGVLVRFTRATIDVDAPDARTLTVDAGGAQVGLGVRFAF
jgi:opacity protein-like surface antigen